MVTHGNPLVRFAGWELRRVGFSGGLRLEADAIGSPFNLSPALVTGFLFRERNHRRDHAWGADPAACDDRRLPEIYPRSVDR